MADESEDQRREAPAFNSLVAQAKVRECDAGEWAGISLTEMWRAANLPADHTPEKWAFEHRDLFAGLSAYIFALKPNHYRDKQVSPCPPGRIDFWSYGVLDCWHGEGGGPNGFCYGDIITEFEPVAACYAMFVDEAIDAAFPGSLPSLAETD